MGILGLGEAWSSNTHGYDISRRKGVSSLRRHLAGSMWSVMHLGLFLRFTPSVALGVFSGIGSRQGIFFLLFEYSGTCP